VPAPGAAAPAAQGFKLGDVALFDPETAKELVETKAVAEYDTNRDDKGKVFVRELRDYAQLFREATRRRTELTAQIAEVSAQAERVAAAQAEVKGDVEAIEKERSGLKSDLAKFQAEREAVTAFVAGVDKRNEELRAKLSETFRANIRLAAELEQINRRSQQEIDRRNPPVQSQASLAAPTP
jgi:chromosome segregation ATPase